MQIIFLSSSRGGNGRIQIGWGWALVTLMLVAGTGVALIKAGMRWGAEAATQQMLTQLEAQEPLWQSQLDQQRTDWHKLNEALELNLNALAVKLGEMQAHIARVNALGERLAAMAKLPSGEFDFSAAPATGGPATVNPASSDVTDIAAAFARLSREIDDRTEKLHALESMLLNRDLHKQTSPAGIPLIGGWMSSTYGNRIDPLTGKREFHTGIDFTGSNNSKIVALAAGVVNWSGWRSEYGNVVEINHGNGTVTRYAHNKKNLVKVGDTVKKGQEIGIMGATGRTTGAHVHFEVIQDGKVVNPIDYTQSAQDASRNSRRQDS